MFQFTPKRTRLLALTVLLASPSAVASDTTAAPEGTAAQPEGQKSEQADAEDRFEVAWYGYLKLDASWDDSIIDPGNFARWAVSPSIVEEHPHFTVTARQTRVGVDLAHIHGENQPITAKLEIDFYGGGAENKNRPQLRHAYFDVPWDKQGLVLTAGQTSDVISPLVPPTLNYTVAWWAGNIGYRRPMVRLSKSIRSASGGVTQLVAAVSRTIGDDFGSPEPGDSGVDAGFPTVQAAVSRSFAMGFERPAKIGISAHWGHEQLEETLGEPVPEYDSWSANLDFSFPLGQTSTLKGEVWTGANLDDYFGGIGQGIDFGRDLEIEASGGWLSFDTKIAPETRVSAGVGMDDPDDATLPSGARSRNQAAWVNFLWGFRSHLRFGVEGSWWATDYLGLEDGSSLRLQTSLIYGFSSPSS